MGRTKPKGFSESSIIRAQLSPQELAEIWADELWKEEANSTWWEEGGLQSHSIWHGQREESMNI